MINENYDGINVRKTCLEEGSETPLVFIHGGFHGSWVWDNYLNYFSERGWNCFAVDLRGHHLSRALHPGALVETGIEDYVDDVRQVLGILNRSPILIGHSIGGLIAPKVAEICAVKGVVMIAPSPPAGVKSGILLKDLDPTVPLVLERDRIDQLYLSRIPQDQREKYFDLFCPESPRAIRQIADGDIYVDAEKLIFPKLVVNGFLDPQHNNGEDINVAQYYNAPCFCFPGMGHDMMLETNWETVAEVIALWLENIAT